MTVVNYIYIPVMEIAYGEVDHDTEADKWVSIVKHKESDDIMHLQIHDNEADAIVKITEVMKSVLKVPIHAPARKGDV